MCFAGKRIVDIFDSIWQCEVIAVKYQSHCLFERTAENPYASVSGCTYKYVAKFTKHTVDSALLAMSSVDT